jgi:hypothetical protein
MKRYLLAVGTLAVIVGIVVAQDSRQRDAKGRDTRPGARPDPQVQFGKADPFQPDQKGPSPFGGPLTSRFSPAAARRAIPQYEEEVELIEAQRDIRKAHVRAAEVAVKSAETQFDLLDKSGSNIPQMERMKARLEVEAARAQLEIKVAEVKEVEVRVKYSKKRLEDAKTAAAAPPPAQRGFDPPPVDRPPPPPGNDQ